MIAQLINTKAFHLLIHTEASSLVAAEEYAELSQTSSSHSGLGLQSCFLFKCRLLGCLAALQSLFMKYLNLVNPCASYIWKIVFTSAIFLYFFAKCLSLKLRSETLWQSYTPTLICVLNYLIHWQVLLIFIPLCGHIFLKYLNQVRSFSHKKEVDNLNLIFVSRLNFKSLYCSNIFMVLSPVCKG